MLEFLVQRTDRLMYTFLGWVFILTSLLAVFFYYDSYLESNQQAFHFPLMVGFLVIFLRHLNIFWLGVAGLLSFWVYEWGLINEILQKFILESQWLPEYVVAASNRNPQYAKLFVYAIVIAVLGVMVLFKKQRTAERFFAFISCIASLLVVYSIHLALPMGSLKFEQEVAIKNMDKLAKYVSKQGDKIHTLKEICKSLSLKCYHNVSIDNINRVVLDPDDLSNLSSYLYGMQSDSVRYQAFEMSHYDFENDLKRQATAIVKIDKRHFGVMIDEGFINQSQHVTEELFGRLALIANLVWGYLLMLIAIMHVQPWRKQVFGGRL